MNIPMRQPPTPDGFATVAPLPERRRLLSLALASMIASSGTDHVSDDDVFEMLRFDVMNVRILDVRLSDDQRDDVRRYLVSIDAHLGAAAPSAVAAHEETCLALKPSLICMRWPGKTS